MSVRRAVGLAVLLSLGVAGCGDDDVPPPASFAPLNYSYLSKLSLNVGSIDIQNQSAPIGPDDVSAQSPVTPAQALQQIGHDRLFAAGLAGAASFVIDQASIVRGAQGGLYGTMAVHLDVTGADGRRAGTAEARVARSHTPGSEPENMQTVLYSMTKDMADAMNVELEYQMKRSLGGLMVSSAVLPSAVTAVPLAPGTPPAGPEPLPASEPSAASEPLPGAEPSAGVEPPAGDDGSGRALEPGEPAPPQEMSPPPGYLQLPPASGQ